VWALQGAHRAGSGKASVPQTGGSVCRLSVELSDGADQLCSLERLFMVTNVASSLMYVRNQ